MRKLFIFAAVLVGGSVALSSVNRLQAPKASLPSSPAPPQASGRKRSAPHAKKPSPLRVMVPGAVSEDKKLSQPPVVGLDMGTCPEGRFANGLSGGVGDFPGATVRYLDHIALYRAPQPGVYYRLVGTNHGVGERSFVLEESDSENIEVSGRVLHRWTEVNEETDEFASVPYTYTSLQPEEVQELLRDVGYMQTAYHWEMTTSFTSPATLNLITVGGYPKADSAFEMDFGDKHGKFSMDCTEPAKCRCQKL